MAVPLRVMTFNVRYGTADDGPDRWELRRPRALEMLARRRPDLLGSQEGLAFQVEEMAQTSGYVAVGAGREDGRTGGEFAAILYDPQRLWLLRSETFWLSPTPEGVGSKGWGASNVRICTWAFFRDRLTGGDLYHYNVHLDHLSSPARQNGIALVLERIAARSPEAPVLVSGDFNAGEDDPVQARMRAAGFRDSYRVLHPRVANVTTFNGWEETPRGDKIDYLFVEGETEVVEAEIVRDRFDGRWVSDHMPVTATLRF